MNNADSQYLRILQRLVDKADGDIRPDRTGTGTYSLFGEQMRFNLQEGFPLLTTKKVFIKGIIVELLWFLRGDTNVKYLHEHGVTIWDEWADEHGDLGPVYGKQWRSWPSSYYLKGAGDNDYKYVVNIIDQIGDLINRLETDPYSRRHIVTAWNPAEIDNMALPPCHCLFQFHVANGKLSCHLYQRSADWFLGVPFNIASYALLTHLIARETSLEVGDFVHSFGDLHLYSNHVEQAKEQLSRTPFDDLPKLDFRQTVNSNSIFDLTPEDIHVFGYRSHPAIKADISK